MSDTTKDKVYIVEDMGITRATLTSVLNRNNYCVCGSSATAEKAWVEIQELVPELVLLDINLRGAKSGLWLAEKIRSQLEVSIVFLTAYGSNEVLDKLSFYKPDGYIMKPFNNATLLGTIKFAISNFSTFKTKSSTVEEDHISFVKTTKGIEKIIANQILYLQSDGNYVSIHMKDVIHICRNKLDDLLEGISFKNLKKTHRRFAVNINKLTNISTNYVLIDGIEIPVSKTYKNFNQ